MKTKYASVLSRSSLCGVPMSSIKLGDVEKLLIRAMGEGLLGAAEAAFHLTLSPCLRPGGGAAAALPSHRRYSGDTLTCPG